jgi:putative DNA primase/helicase
VSLRSTEREEIMRAIEKEAECAPPSSVAGWPDPAELGDELLPVSTFGLELLPPSLRGLVDDISERMQAPRDYAAAAAIVALAGCVNRRAVIIPKQEDKSWHVVPNLWGAIVAPPGMMKSPILREVTLPLAQIEKKWRVEFENAYGDFEIEKEQTELRLQAWREQYKQAIKKNENAPTQPDKKLCSPSQKRIILTDATFEKLHEILAQNPTGVLVIRDELTGWLSELDRLGREGERAFFLQAWSGDAGFTVDRIGRGSVHVPAVCVSLIGNIQPARLRSYLSDAIEGGPTDDGLFQRFQILVWPDLPRRWQLVDRPANLLAFQTAERIFSMLAELPADDPVSMYFSPEAQRLFFEWLKELEEKVRGDSGLAPAFVGHLAKYRSLMPSLAGLFELADLAAADNLSSKEISISVEHARQAAALCDFFEVHARRVYASVISLETRAARELARHIKSGDLPPVFTTRSVYLKGWASINTPERVRGALALLEEAEWVCRRALLPLPTGGRPSEAWIVNPKVIAHAQ